MQTKRRQGGVHPRSVAGRKRRNAKRMRRVLLSRKDSAFEPAIEGRISVPVPRPWHEGVVLLKGASALSYWLVPPWLPTKPDENCGNAIETIVSQTKSRVTRFFPLSLSVRPTLFSYGALFQFDS